jgi:hypothetical protein
MGSKGNDYIHRRLSTAQQMQDKKELVTTLNVTKYNNCLLVKLSRRLELNKLFQTC